LHNNLKLYNIKSLTLKYKTIMSTTKELYEQIKSLYEAFDENHNQNAESGTKASGTRARKAIGEIKKLATEYRKASVAESKKD
jgi:hypothetical protein